MAKKCRPHSTTRTVTKRTKIPGTRDLTELSQSHSAGLVLIANSASVFIQTFCHPKSSEPLLWNVPGSSVGVAILKSDLVREGDVKLLISYWTAC